MLVIKVKELTTKRNSKQRQLKIVTTGKQALRLRGVGHIIKPSKILFLPCAFMTWIKIGNGKSNWFTLV